MIEPLVARDVSTTFNRSGRWLTTINPMRLDFESVGHVVVDGRCCCRVCRGRVRAGLLDSILARSLQAERELWCPAYSHRFEHFFVAWSLPSKTN
jgi:hypothetical protein